MLAAVARVPTYILDSAYTEFSGTVSLRSGDSNMAKQEASVTQLVSMIEKGQIRLPEMQRKFVWKATKVRDLLDSLYRGYPSGTILMWEPEESVALTSFSVKTDDKSAFKPMLLLDGQQRLTSLSCVLRGEPVTVRGRKKPIDILFNLEHPADPLTSIDVDEDDEDEFDSDEFEQNEDSINETIQQMTFVVSSTKLAASPNWIRVSDVFRDNSDKTFLARAGVESFNDPRYDKYTERIKKLRAVRDYVYRMDVLEPSLSYEEVTEIFVRVNSLGAKLRGSDLALAQITARWRDSLRIFEELQAKILSDHKFDLELGTILRSLVIQATGQSKFKTVSSLSQSKLEVAWKENERAMTFALNFLRSNVKIDSSALLTSPYIILVIAFWGAKRAYKISDAEATKMTRWVLLANAKARFARGSSESILDQDLVALRDGGGAEQLLERLVVQVGRLEITPSELVGRNAGSGLFKTMFLAFKEDGARDWNTNLAISVNHSGKQDKLQFHHIFPTAYMKKQAQLMDLPSTDDIANLAFIGGKTNREISDKAPAEYLKKILEGDGKVQLENQAIPTELELLKPESYSDFLTLRRKLIADRLNRFLGN